VANARRTLLKMAEDLQQVIEPAPGRTDATPTLLRGHQQDLRIQSFDQFLIDHGMKPASARVRSDKTTYTT